MEDPVFFSGGGFSAAKSGGRIGYDLSVVPSPNGEWATDEKVFSRRVLTNVRYFCPHVLGMMFARMLSVSLILKFSGVSQRTCPSCFVSKCNCASSSVLHVQMTSRPSPRAKPASK